MQPDIHSHLSSGVHDQQFGFERWTFTIAFTAIKAALTKAARMEDPEYIKEIIHHYWMQQNRIPSRAEISELRIGKVDARGRVEVTATIKRGHWFLASVFLGHQGVSATKSEDNPGFVHIVCKCCPNAERLIPVSSLPEVGS